MSNDNKEKKELSMEALELISGGALCAGWEATIDKFLSKSAMGSVAPLKRAGVAGFPPLLQGLLEDVASVCGQEEAEKIENYVNQKFAVLR